MQILIWIFYNKFLSQVIQPQNVLQGKCWFSDVTKWILRKLSAFFNGGQNMKPFFLELVFWLAKSYGLLGLKLRLKGFFFWTKIFTNLRRCHSQAENWQRLILVSKNWSNDFRIDLKPPSNLVELIEKDLNFEKLKEFESSFEQDELLNI